MANLEIDLVAINMTSKQFEDLAFDCANDKHWCKMHHIDFVKLSYPLVKTELYQELLTSKQYKETQLI